MIRITHYKMFPFWEQVFFGELQYPSSISIGIFEHSAIERIKHRDCNDPNTRVRKDPREAKLREIIEKEKASLHKTLEEIQHEFSIKDDMAVRPTAIDFLSFQ